ncbi:MAG: TDP-N-acetylfucosamine:lipid II N-acetylfucosaminyltransferase [Roseburia sp.]|jgi:dTDP-N-acetylfucosamine:lipid II N-acetylfucosaminyltransferase|nr:TDP-N-acetylfucosamine:lipid II N-acetylfucosaminyltransferase [Roseburia sp.]
MEIKFLHIMLASQYAVDYIKRINKLYNPQEHFFIIYNCKKPSEYNFLVRGVKVLDIGRKEIKIIWKLAHKVKHVYLQSLYFNKSAMLLIAFLSVRMKKHFSWYIWGEDLVTEYENELMIKGLMIKKRIKRFCRKRIIRNLKYIISIIPSDYEYALDAYKSSAKGVVAFYSYPMPDEKLVQKDKQSSNSILVGHTAIPWVRHIETFEKIAKSGYQGEVISILSYGGNENYVNEVLHAGQEKFGNRFKPILGWMSQAEYVELLSGICSAVFPAQRQNGAGNILYLLYLGKKVFLDKGNGILGYLKSKGVCIYDISSMEDEDFSVPLAEEQIQINRKVIGYLCSDENFKKEWDIIFGIDEG